MMEHDFSVPLVAPMRKKREVDLVLSIIQQEMLRAMKEQADGGPKDEQAGGADD